MELTIEREAASDGRQVLTLAGSLDLASKAAVLEAAAQAFAAPGMTGLVLDLAAVSFIDSSGIGMMVELAGDAKDADRAFALRQPSKQVARILQVTGLSDAWSVES